MLTKLYYILLFFQTWHTVGYWVRQKHNWGSQRLFGPSHRCSKYWQATDRTLQTIPSDIQRAIYRSQSTIIFLSFFNKLHENTKKYYFRISNIPLLLFIVFQRKRQDARGLFCLFFCDFPLPGWASTYYHTKVMHALLFYILPPHVQVVLKYLSTYLS